MDPQQWQSFINGTYDPNPHTEQKTDMHIARRIMDVYLTETSRAMEWLGTSKCALEDSQRAVLRKRYAQIRGMVREAMGVVNPCTGFALEYWSQAGG